jgi:hypothetical protein
MFSSNVESAYDYLIAYCLLRSGGKVVYFQERLTEYRIQGASATVAFSFTNTMGAIDVNGLIMNDPTFTAIAGEIQIWCMQLNGI